MDAWVELHNGPLPDSRARGRWHATAFLFCKWNPGSLVSVQSSVYVGARGDGTSALDVLISPAAVPGDSAHDRRYEQGSIRLSIGQHPSDATATADGSPVGGRDWRRSEMRRGG